MYAFLYLFIHGLFIVMFVEQIIVYSNSMNVFLNMEGWWMFKHIFLCTSVWKTALLDYMLRSIHAKISLIKHPLNLKSHSQNKSNQIFEDLPEI